MLAAAGGFFPLRNRPGYCKKSPPELIAGEWRPSPAKTGAKAGKFFREVDAMTLEGVNTPLSGDTSIDGLIWQDHPTYAAELPFANFIEFSFNNDYIADSGVSSGTSKMTEAQKGCVRNVLDYFSKATGIFFSEVPDAVPSNDLIFANKGLGTGSGVTGMDFYKYVYTAGSSPVLDLSDAILINSDYPDLANLAIGTQGYATLMEEVGHALGLKHPTDPPIIVPGVGDTTQATIMGYSYDGNPPITGTPLDDRVLAWVYGGKGLQNTGRVPLGGSATGSWTVVDRGATSWLAAYQ
jgi:serralysin